VISRILKLFSDFRAIFVRKKMQQLLTVDQNFKELSEVKN